MAFVRALAAAKGLFSTGSKTAAKAMSKGASGFTSVMALGIPTYMGYSNAEKGQKLQGTVKGLAEGLVYAYMPQLFFAEIAGSALEGAGNWYMERMHQGPWERFNAGRPNFGGGFKDTQQAATMRQRALEEMQRSHINARSVLGSEARTYHRSGAYSGRW
jgi:hypothetical protein